MSSLECPTGRQRCCLLLQSWRKTWLPDLAQNLPSGNRSAPLRVAAKRLAAEFRNGHLESVDHEQDDDDGQHEQRQSHAPAGGLVEDRRPALEARGAVDETG